jgi:hypothetical protein
LRPGTEGQAFTLVLRTINWWPSILSRVAPFLGSQQKKVADSTARRSGQGNDVVTYFQPSLVHMQTSNFGRRITAFKTY